jgi:nicotinate-nucleotide pyrophosphorylase (carboxylating)
MDKKIITRVKMALQEDRADADVTTQYLVDQTHQGIACIVAREEAVICGLAYVQSAFEQLDPQMNIQCHRQDGQVVKHGDKVVTLEGKTRAILSAERVALNFLGFLSGVASITRQFVDQVKPLKTQILDTRKTPPGLRDLVKMAVVCGGGKNHRMHLNEMIMIKDNHWMAHGKTFSLDHVIRKIRTKTRKPIEVEVDDLLQFRTALAARPDMILLDNMSIASMKKAVALNEKEGRPCLLEASGGVTLANVKRIAQTGVDRISIGALTHSLKNRDFSMEYEGAVL